MAAEEEVTKLLKEHGAVLTRSKKHNIWKFPDGRTWTSSHTPSDFRAHDKQLSELRNMLGLQKHQTVVGERRPKIKKRPRPEQPSHVQGPSPAILQAFQKAGMVEQHISYLGNRISFLESNLCWWCKLKLWWHGKKP